VKKNLPLIIVGAVVLVGLGIGGWMFLGKGKQEAPAPAEVEEETAPAEEEKGFTGKLKDALTLGQSMKCTWKQDEDNFATSYIKDSKIRTEVTQAGTKMHSIMADDCNYSWEEGKTQGLKICFEPEEEEEEAEEVAPEEATVETPDYEYNCSPAVVSDSMFNPPTSINFMDMSQMMQVGE